MQRSIYDMERNQLAAWFGDQGQQKFRAQQVWDWLYKKRVSRFSEMRNLNKEARRLLEEHFSSSALNEAMRQEARDGTVKFLFQLQDGHLIETVLMRQPYGLSVCVTTQVGCNIGCSFCASGLLKKTRNLTCGEIVEQVVQVQRYLDQNEPGRRVSHVVVMGIGEPFDNFEQLVKFLSIINDQHGLAIGARHITVSTSGIVPKIYQFAELNLQVNLAVSLHASTDQLRTRLMKINKAYPLQALLEACWYYVDKTNRRITFEYILLKEVNDQPHHARLLAQLVRPKRHLVYINLIPYNPVDEHQQYERSSLETIQAFYQILKLEGIQCGIRREHGTDIDAACGQLRSKQMKRSR